MQQTGNTASTAVVRSSVSDRLCEELKQLIVSDDVNIGDKMPTEQALCTRFGVGRSTVREALRTLQAKGLLEIRRGSGAYVVSKVETSEDGWLWISGNKDNIREYMEVRIAIEVLAVKRFIVLHKGNSEVLDQVQNRFERAVAKRNVDLMASMDAAFHQTLGNNTNNSVLANLNRVIQTEFNRYRRVTFENEFTRNDAVEAHRRILDAIRRQATDDAVEAVRRHLTISFENAIAGIDEDQV